MIRSSRLLVHAPAFIILWIVLARVNTMLDPLWSYYLALAAMYATAMMGMVILVGLSGQVSLGNGALMAVGGYAFAVSSMHMTTVPIIGVPWNAVWSMVVAGLAGVIVGGAVGALGARLRGPYLAGLTLGLAVGIPAIASRFPSLFGGNQGLLLQVPFPEGGYASASAEAETNALETAADDAAALDAALGIDSTATAAPSAEPSMAADDMLTLEDVTVGGAAESSGAEPTVAAEDMLTLEDVTVGGAAEPSASAPSMAPEDMLTVDDVTSGGAATPPVEPLASATAMPDVPVDGADVAQAGFILEQWQASVSIALACIMGFVALNMVRGRQGQVWRAVRDDPIAAAVTGLHPGRAKVSAFVVSSLFAALAGAVFVQILAYAGPGAFGIGLSLSLLVGVVLGGRDSLAGAVIGALLLVGLPIVITNVAGDRGWPEQVANNSPSLIYGLLVVLVVLLLPGGLVSLVRRKRR